MKDLLWLFLGLSCLALGSHWLVGSLKSFSIRFKVKPLFLSIVVLGFVSSAPEWFVTMTAGLKDRPDAALGNIIGSNVINILLVLALTGLFYSFQREKQILQLDMPVLIGSSLILALFSIDQKINFLEALFLIGIFTLYLVLLFQKRKKPSQEVLPLDKHFSIKKSFLALAVGFVLLFAGSSLSVDSSLNLVETFSLSERFAGVFILSLSTSLPELAASLQSVLKKEGGMALGNIVGSNIFNTLFVLGSAGLFKPLHFSKELYYDYFFMIFVTGLLALSLFFFKKIPKILFGFFIVSYFFYIVFVSSTG